MRNLIALLLYMTVWTSCIALIKSVSDEATEVEENACQGDYFHCVAGGSFKCIPRIWLCDDQKDCHDGADEEEQVCPDHANEECTDKQMECPTDHRCIFKTWMCDGKADCDDGTDEKDCDHANACSEKEFACSSGNRCVAISDVCDGRIDCPDGSDEQHCNCSASHPFSCNDGEKCPPTEKVCNKVKDCKDGSDEGGRCDEECMLECTDGKCFQSPIGPRCECNDGFKEISGKCMDIDECEQSLCDHVCINKEGNYTCVCYSGYTAVEDGVCKVIDPSPAHLFYTERTEIRAMDLHNKIGFTVYSGSYPTIAVAYDPMSKKVYWSDHAETLQRKSFSGDEPPEMLIQKNIGIVKSIAIDWFGRNMYIVTNEKNIVVCNINTLSCKRLLTRTNKLTTIKLDIKEKRMYWTEEHAIMRASMDGKDVYPLVKEGVVWPNAFTIDVTARTIYWMDSKREIVEKYSLNTHERKEIPGIVIKHPYSMAVWEDKLYWTDIESKQLASAHKTNGKNKTLILERFQGIGLSIYHKQMFESLKGETECESAGCSHICLLSSEHSSYTCECPDEMIISLNKKQCLDKKLNSALVLGFKSDIYKVKMREYSDPILKRLTHHADSFKRISDIGYNPLTGEVFVSDEDAMKIMKIKLDTFSLTTVVTDLEPTGIAVDWEAGNLYWVDRSEASLYVSTLEGKHRTKLALGGFICEGLDVEIAPTNGDVIIACDGRVIGRIIKCNRKGDTCRVLADEKIRTPLGLTVKQHTDGDTVYWADSHYNRIEMISLNGKNRRGVSLDLKRPAGIQYSAGIIYISVVGDKNLLKIDEHFSSETIEVVHVTSRDKIDTGGHIALSEITLKTAKLAEVRSSYNRTCYDGTPCQQLCLLDVNRQKMCACEMGKELSDDNRSCKIFDCGPGKLTCVLDNKCFLEAWKCDGIRHCSDGSDEAPKLCRCDEKNKFICKKTKECISKEKKCDGHNDCLDHSDEEGCPARECSPAFSKCNDGDCYMDIFKCDGYNDCDDATDEKDCSHLCPDHEFKCADGKGLCQPRTWLCNGSPECNDGSDEHNCTEACSSGLECLDTKKCLQRSQLCDDIEDCDDGQDEHPEMCFGGYSACASGSSGSHNCNRLCGPGEFACASGTQCIASRFLCDGTSNCEDTSDEKDCATGVESGETLKNNCGRTQFDCGGECIPTSKVCDGVQDCPNHSDESALCEKSCLEGGGCDHLCRKEPGDRKCYCKVGYKLQKDGHTCMDFDECKYADPCEHYCNNTKGRFSCTCDEGYSLASDAVSCRQNSGKYFGTAIISGQSIRWHGSSSNRPSSLIISATANISRIDYDSVRKNILSLDYGGILGIITLDDSRFTPVITELQTPTAFAMDAPGGNVYVAQDLYVLPQAANIIVCSLWSITTVCWPIYEEPNAIISSLAVAKKDRKLYACINGQKYGHQVSKILQMKLDGSSRITIVERDIKSCSHIAIDERKERIYLVDPLMKRISSAKLSGHEVTTFRNIEKLPINLELSGFFVYWLQSDGDQQICHKDVDWCKTVNVGINGHAAAGIKISGITHNVTDVCKVGTCSNLCITVGGRAKCVCNNPKMDSNCTVPNVARSTHGCEPDPCAPGGICLLDSRRGYICKCKDGYEGNTCYVVREGLDTGDSYVTPLVVVLVILSLVGVSGGLYYYYKRPLLFFKKRSSQKSQVRFSNPAFGAPKDEIDTALQRSSNGLDATAMHPASYSTDSQLQSVHIDDHCDLKDGNENSSNFGASSHSSSHNPNVN